MSKSETCENVLVVGESRFSFSQVSFDEFLDFALEEPRCGAELGVVAAGLRSALGVKGCASLRSELTRDDREKAGVCSAADVWRALRRVCEELDLTAVQKKRAKLSSSVRKELAARFAVSKDAGDDCAVRYSRLCAWLEQGLGE